MKLTHRLEVARSTEPERTLLLEVDGVCVQCWRFDGDPQSIVVSLDTGKSIALTLLHSRDKFDDPWSITTFLAGNPPAPLPGDNLVVTVEVAADDPLVTLDLLDDKDEDSVDPDYGMTMGRSFDEPDDEEEMLCPA